jgi:hypothetical protein
MPPLVTTVQQARRIGDWDAGQGGYTWKQRHLGERRSMAVNYLTNVELRTPIHDAVRMRAKLNEERLKSSSLGGSAACSDVLMTSLNHAASLPLGEEERGLRSHAESVTGGSLDDDLRAMEEERWDSWVPEEGDLASEYSLDCLRHLPKHDIAALLDEFYGDAMGQQKAKNDEVLRNWFQLRKDTNPYRIFQGIPESERTMWSAWYLRDIKPLPEE